MSRKLSVTEAARNFSDVVNRVLYRGESMDLTRGRKVVARLVPAGTTAAPTGRELIEAWGGFPHLSEKEGDAFAHDIKTARESLNRAPVDQWD